MHRRTFGIPNLPSDSGRTIIRLDVDLRQTRNGLCSEEGWTWNAFHVLEEVEKYEVPVGGLQPNWKLITKIDRIGVLN